ncbi:MAG TPA: hypothetical protein VJ578_01555 [Dehalococcoidia bacterium]|nr:hypothetical protein [Dehalococcoidia bacterium]
MLVAGLSALAAACGGDDGEEGEIRDTADAIVKAYNDGDVDAFLSYWTDSGIQEGFDATREEAQEFLAEGLGEPPMSLRSISNIEVSGDTASAEVELVFGKLLQPERDSFVKEGGVWKIDATEDIAPEIPSDVTAIDLKLAEFAFDFDASAMTDGDIAFRVENVGEQPHQVILSKIPEDLDLEAALQSEETPPGVEDIAVLEFVDAGAKADMVFTESLEPGRYVLLCFFPDTQDPEGTPHVFKGMQAEFNVQ